MRNFNNKEILEAEELLVSRIKEGDRTAMRTLYDRFSGYVMAVALRYVPDKMLCKTALSKSSHQ